MKKLLMLLFVAVIAASCSLDYKSEIKPKTFEGVKMEIDSTKWTPALIQVGQSKLTVYESGEIREVRLTDEWDTYFFGFVMGFVMCFIIAIIFAARD